jgi:hypothetical protein
VTHVTKISRGGRYTSQTDPRLPAARCEKIFPPPARQRRVLAAPQPRPPPSQRGGAGCFFRGPFCSASSCLPLGRGCCEQNWRVRRAPWIRKQRRVLFRPRHVARRHVPARDGNHDPRLTSGAARAIPLASKGDLRGWHRGGTTPSHWMPTCFDLSFSRASRTLCTASGYADPPPESWMRRLRSKRQKWRPVEEETVIKSQSNPFLVEASRPRIFSKRFVLNYVLICSRPVPCRGGINSCSWR